MTTVLKYIGRGDAFYHIPAHDLTEEDLAAIAELPEEYRMDEAALIRSGLYAKEQEEAKPEKKTRRGATIDADKEGE